MSHTDWSQNNISSEILWPDLHVQWPKGTTGANKVTANSDVINQFRCYLGIIFLTLVTYLDLITEHNKRKCVIRALMFTYDTCLHCSHVQCYFTNTFMKLIVMTKLITSIQYFFYYWPRFFFLRMIKSFWRSRSGNVRSNTRYVHLAVTPSAARQLNRRLRPLRGIKGCRDHTIVCVGF